MNSATIVGNLGDDPELRYTPNGVAVCSLSVAVASRYLKDGEWVDGETTWIRAQCWRELAENVAESLSKGARVIIAGKLQTRSWETEGGEKRSVLEIQAEEVGPSLRWATAAVTRQKKGDGGE